MTPVSDGGYGDYDELLADVILWMGTDKLVKMGREVEEVLDGNAGEAGDGGGEPTQMKAMMGLMETQG